MLTIRLKGESWTSQEDFYAALLPALGAPAWHGHNLDALNDSIVGGGINTVNPPFAISITGLQSMGAEARTIVNRFADLIRELRSGGVPVSVDCD
ncbi:MAG TPA: barstar family protein [Polyangiaceae bacterium]